MFLRRLIDLTCKLRANHHRIWLNAEARADVQWWTIGLNVFHGFTHFVCDMKPPTSQFVTNACREGGGGLYQSDWFYTNFAADFPEFVGSHINCLELLTVLVAVRRWGASWKGCHIRVNCDNSASVCAINKGSSKSPLFMKCLREIFWWSVKYNFRLTASHIRGVHNSSADMVSRLHMPMFMTKFLNQFNPSGRVVNFVHNMSPRSFMFLQGFTPS